VTLSCRNVKILTLEPTTRLLEPNCPYDKPLGQRGTFKKPACDAYCVVN